LSRNPTRRIRRRLRTDAKPSEVRAFRIAVRADAERLGYHPDGTPGQKAAYVRLLSVMHERGLDADAAHTVIRAAEMAQ
jgi:hypothetical protein